MQAYGSVEAPSPALKGAAQVLTSLGLLVAGLATCLPVYGGWFSGSVEDLFRFGMPLLWGGLALVTTRSVRLSPFRVPLLCLFGVSLGLALAHVVDGMPVDLLGLSVDTPKGAMVDKIFGEVIPMSAAMLLAAYLARLSLKSLGLRGGRVWLSLELGLLVSVPIMLFFVFDPSGTNKTVWANPAATLLSWFPWIAVFSIANGFNEELWFRGLWLAGFGQAIGRTAAMHVTSWAFCLMHVIVYWQEPTMILMLTPVWLYMGYAFALIMRKTGSLWGPVLAHAIADVIFMYIYFSA